MGVGGPLDVVPSARPKPVNASNKAIAIKKLVENEREGSKQLVRQDEIHIGHWGTKLALDTRNLRQCYILMRYVCKFVIKSFESIHSRSMRK